MSFFKVTRQAKKGRARLGKIITPHGAINTPAFVPVGTNATVKGISPAELKEIGVQIFFANTYHLFLKPGSKIIKRAGGLHKFSGWEGPIITDSGGFQVFSLGRIIFRPKGDNIDYYGGKLVKIAKEGVYFRSPVDGKELFLGPAESIRIQHDLGADLLVAFDDCTPYPVSEERAALSLEKTHYWAAISLETHKELSKKQKNKQFLYGVVQGSYYKRLRERSARFISSLDFDGIAIGGVSVGEPKIKMRQAVSWIMPFLPKNKPRHLLGVGQIDDIFDFVQMGVDTFDCVIPTRLGRMGKILVKNNSSPVDIAKKKFQNYLSPIDKACQCYTCKNFSLAYLHHLFRVKELLVYRLLTIHNLMFFSKLMSDIRAAIREEKLEKVKDEYLEK